MNSNLYSHMLDRGNRLQENVEADLDVDGMIILEWIIKNELGGVSSGSEHGRVAGRYERGYELSGFVKGGKLSGQLSDSQLIYNHAPWRYFGPNNRTHCPVNVFFMRIQESDIGSGGGGALRGSHDSPLLSAQAAVLLTPSQMRRHKRRLGRRSTHHVALF
jgi:hypothetical protein